MSLILVTNDDGINSPGVKVLAEAMKSLGEPFIAAPAVQQSATGRSVTIETPLRVSAYYENGEKIGLAVNGTPSDTAKLAINALMKEKPILVVSGVNYGRNTSINVQYSGTVAAAAEGALAGVPSLAVSLDSFSLKSDPSVAAEIAAQIAKKALEMDLPKGVFLNVNVPNLPKNEIKGLVVTRLSDSYWADSYEKRTDPFGREYYWFSGQYKVVEDGLESDDSALSMGYVSITPLRFNFFDEKTVPLLREELSKIF